MAGMKLAKNDIKGHESNKVIPFPNCSLKLKKDTVVPLCSGRLTSTIIAPRFATVAAENKDPKKAKTKKLIY